MMQSVNPAAGRALRLMFIALVAVPLLVGVGVAPRAATPGITEYAIPDVPNGTTFDAITAGPDGNLWFTESGTGIARIAKITSTGVVTAYDVDVVPKQGLGGILADQALGGITAGADGNVWFVLPDANRIARITLDGAVVTYPVPTPQAGLSRIVGGLGGDVWFSESIGRAPGSVGGPFRSKVGRITPAGAITEYDTTGVLTALFVGPDGILWVIGGGEGATIATIDAAGTVSSLPITGAAARAYGGAVGPDGNVWLAYWQSCRPNACLYITTVTPAGVATQYDAPTPPNRIVAGPDGNLWYASFGIGGIVRVTTAGAFARYGAGQVTDLAVGPDGALWFTQSNRTIGRLDPKVAMPLPSPTPRPSPSIAPPTATRPPEATLAVPSPAPAPDASASLRATTGGIEPPRDR